MKARIQNQIIILVVLLILISGVGGTISFLSVQGPAYSTGYQGARGTFVGINWENRKYTNQDRHGASSASFDTTLSFDPDDALKFKPDLKGEMTSVFIPEESLLNTPTWVPADWQRNVGYITNPKKTYEWTIDNKTYTMEEWTLRWYLSISCDPSQEVFPKWESEGYDQRYSNAEVWMQLDLTPVWVFEGAESAYFAIAKIQVAEVKLSARDLNGNEQSPRTDISIVPESKASILSIYHAPFKQSGQANKDAYYYKDKKLNPDLFTDKAYTYVTLDNFGTVQWTEWTPIPVMAYKGDVVTFALDVTVFVIGQWDLKDIEPLPDDYGRTSKYVVPAWSLNQFLASSEGRLMLLILAGLAILLLLAIFAPTALLSLYFIFGGRRKK